MKVMLDECITKGPAKTVIQFLSLQDIEAHFLIDFLSEQGARDEVWPLLLQPPNEWIVITGDTMRSGPQQHIKGAPLPIVLPTYGITGFFLKGKLFNNANGAERARVIISMMPQILAAAQCSAGGERFRISYQGSGFKLQPWPPKARE